MIGVDGCVILLPRLFSFFHAILLFGPPNGFKISFKEVAAEGAVLPEETLISPSEEDFSWKRYRGSCLLLRESSSAA